MRRSTLALTAVGISAAAVAGSAFTASNTVPDSVAGYGEGSITGITVNTVQYAPLATDGTLLDHVTFTAASAISNAKVATMTLKLGATVVGTPYSCVIGDGNPLNSSASIVCATADNPAFEAFDTVGLTVTD